MKNGLTFDEVFAITARSHSLAELLGVEEFKRLKKILPEHEKLTLTELHERLPQLEDLISNIKCNDKYLSFQIISDDEGGSDCGPWHVNVHGACGAWVVSSNELDDLWFEDRNRAITAAHDYAHQKIISEVDRGVSWFQLSNADYEKSRTPSSLPIALKEKSLEHERVLGYYLDKNLKIYRHSKYGADASADMGDLAAEAAERSKTDIQDALSKARAIGWKGAAELLSAILKLKDVISGLQSNAAEQVHSRFLELQVDYWLGKNSIVHPDAKDFSQMAHDFKPHFHNREASISWDQKMSSAYNAAYLRLVDGRRKIEADLFRLDEE